MCGVRALALRSCEAAANMKQGITEATISNLRFQPVTELREPTNPLPLLALQDEEMRPTHPFPDMLRVQENWVAAAEKRALLRLPRMLPTKSVPTT